MGFDLAHIMSDIVYLVQMPIGNLACQDLLEGCASVVRQYLSVGEGVVGCTAHGSQIVLPFGRIERGAYQLTVG